MPRLIKDLSAVVFDIDGTLLDSAAGIVAGFQHALRSVGFAPPAEAVLRSDLGPPVDLLFTHLGLHPDLLEEAVSAYRSFYVQHGIQQASAYAGIVDLLESLHGRTPLGTATAKRTDTADAILTEHGLAGYFSVVNGTDKLRTTKPQTIAHTLDLLGGPDPETVIMVGDRHSDIAGGQACGLRTVGVTWGYGSVDELRTAGADLLVDRPADLQRVLG